MKAERHGASADAISARLSLAITVLPPQDEAPRAERAGGVVLAPCARGAALRWIRLPVSVLVHAELEVVSQRIDMGIRQVRVALQVGVGIERGARVTALVPAELLIVEERIDPVCGHVGILLEVVGRIEQFVRVTQLRGPVREVMCQGRSFPV